MDEALAKKCKSKIWKYRLKRSGKKRDKLRNDIYLLMKDDITGWIMGYLKGKTHVPMEEIISHSWDCFLYCLKRYKFNRGIGIPNHFYKYTGFFLQMNPLYQVKEPGRIDWDIAINETTKTEIDKTNLLTVYDQLGELKTFRSMLPEDYYVPFDDAFLSLSPALKDRVYRETECPLTQTKYKESKKLFKIVIDFLLRK